MIPDDEAFKGYYYDPIAGQETAVYILDSGVEQSHPIDREISVIVDLLRPDRVTTYCIRNFPLA